MAAIGIRQSVVCSVARHFLASERTYASIDRENSAWQKLAGFTQLFDWLIAARSNAPELAGISLSDVTIRQKMGEKTPQELSGAFRIIVFDGRQMTISESIAGERRTRGFAVE